MEVKPLNNTNRTQLKKDLDTLTKFLDLGYYKAIHLIYGSLRKNDGGISRSSPKFPVKRVAEHN